MKRSDLPLVLIRHGETTFNAQGRYQGRCDSALTERGIGQAAAVADLLSTRLGDASVSVISSPLGRAAATAEIVVARLKNCVSVLTDDRLNEVGMGAWDGLTRAEIAARWPDARRGRSTREWMFHGPGGESLSDLVERADDLLSDVAAPVRHARILVSHAVTGRIIRARHAGIPILDALKLDAPQDAAFELRPDGGISLWQTPDYDRRNSGPP